MIEITAIRQSGGTGHEHITDLSWKNTATNAIGTLTRQQLVDWLSSQGNQAIVQDAQGAVYVGVVRPENAPPYVRTYKDGRWTDNLLALPRF